MSNTTLIAIVIGVIIALLAVALFLLTRKSANKGHASPLVSRNPNYGPRSDQDHDSAPKPEPAPTPVAVKTVPVVASPLKARPAEAKPIEVKQAPKPVEIKRTEVKPTPVKETPVAKEPVAEEDEWGDDDAWDIDTSASIDAVGETSLEDDFSADVKAQQAESQKKTKKMVDRRSSEDDDDDWGDVPESEDDLQDGWTGPKLTRVSPEIKQAFKEAVLNQEFHVSKRKEADDLIVKCVKAYLAANEDSAVKTANERVYALHSKIQVSDLPEIIESFVDSGDESNQKYFADFEDMCNTHEDSVLVLFEKFNTTLPINLRSRRIAEISEPLPAVLYLAPEWEDDDFDRPDFDERDEDISEDVDYLEDFYDQLEDDDEPEADKKHA
ncbi:hypothetical protein [Cerasicoccus arenae]|uniref:Uncharacterized protein n=1 Tax=Cerasicoccus arenae TaxID=424488 RepID=A0A8J3D723_9BACT|nr:hypothetical protein [Cerasicoccus arenae]MBK1857673.1 hypothetical protein [Cerasicoccus arenae]GHB91462.1 hypothetical protein GCM10007047_03190 [Cerasicoccus arenae]